MAGGAKINRITQISTAVLSSIRSTITTALYTVSQATIASVANLKITRTDTNPVALSLLPNSTGVSSQVNLFNNSDTVNHGVELQAAIDDTSAIIGTYSNAGDAELPLKISVGHTDFTQKETVFNVDGSVTLAGALIFDSSSIFLSGEITGSGSAQNNAHGLGRTPKIAIAYFTKVAVAGDTLSAVTSDGTNCTVTCTSGSKYRILAL